MLVATKATFVELDMDRLAALQARIVAVLNSVPGFISNTLWERVDDPFTFLSIGHYSSEEDSLKAWDVLLRSPVMEVVSDLMSEAPNTLRFLMKASKGMKLEDTKLGHFCSVSYRLADLGYGSSVVDELVGIFQELEVIPGFLGYTVGQMTEIEDEILGIAFWDSRLAFEASLPKKAMYEIHLYSKAL